MKTIRDAFGEALVEIGAREADLVVVDGDNSLATRTSAFQAAFPDRFVQAGIAEANLVGVAAGLAYCGRPVVASTFAAFLIGRALEVIRDTIALDRLPVVIVGTHAGVSVGRDGITHMALEDLAIMRALPGMTVVCPADERQVRPLLEQLITARAPAYVRISRWGRGALEGSEPVELGRPMTLREGRDCLIIVTGLATHSALAAASELAERGLACGVLGIHTIKPLDWAVLNSVAGRYPCLVVAEEAWSSGGLFGTIAEWTVQHAPKPCIPVGVADVFPDGGSEESLFEAYGLMPGDVVRAVQTAVAASDALAARDPASAGRQVPP